MPKRTDIHTIMIIGSGPIVIGQACEFDYSGVQACKALRSQGYRVVLVNSNPATIMTDPEFADATYVEPLTVEICDQIIAIERPDVILPTVGGQTGLNLAIALQEAGVLDKYNVGLIGASLESIRIAEDRKLFKEVMTEIGLKSPQSEVVASVEEALDFVQQIGYPALIRPSYTLGGSGGGIAYNEAELREVVARGIRLSPVGQVLLDKSLIGWKEYELELMRDAKGNFVVVCSIENLDPMGVHTGDSITVAPAQTLTDKELQRLRNMSRAIFDRIGITTGGANVQFAISPTDGEVFVIEMNPRVSRSSALASKATGFPIAKIAAMVAVGFTLDEIPNDITEVTPASFEPSLDYVVVKIPRWDFKKFAGVDQILGPQMKAVGEVMAIGRTFPDALQKAVRALDIGISGLGSKTEPINSPAALRVPTAQRLFQVATAIGEGVPVEEIIANTQFDPWFVQQMQDTMRIHETILRKGLHLDDLDTQDFTKLKRYGYSDAYIAKLTNATEREVRTRRKALGVVANFYRVDTCAAEFEAQTPYLYSTYEEADEAFPTTQKKVMILGGGPNRIGQGIEFDYCCVHACFALKDMGFETIMVNCNPETVSTDYDTADRLYFEPLTAEDVLNIIDREKPDGVLVQFGGQTPLNIARELYEAGAPIWGTSVDTIDLAEDRERFNQLMRELNITQPAGATVLTRDEAFAAAHQIGYPVLVRPSYVLGGRGMAIVFDDETLQSWLDNNVEWTGHPVLIDKFLDDAFEVDVDALCDGERVVIGGIMQHIEEAGVHSGDSACVLPPYKISQYHLDIIRDYTQRIGMTMQIKGLFNIQLAIKNDEVYVLEVNPRSSRTVPFVSKATGKPLARYAAQNRHLYMAADYSDEYIQRLLADLRTKDDTMRQFAMRTLAEPSCHTRAIPVLIDLLDDNTVIYDNTYDAWDNDFLWVCHVASDTLKMIGEPAVPAIMAVLSSDVKPTHKTSVIKLLLHFKVSSALVPILNHFQQQPALAYLSVEVVETLADPARDTALVVPYLKRYYEQEKQDSQRTRQRYNLSRFRQNHELDNVARILGKYHTPWAQFIYWRSRIHRILLTALLIMAGLLFLTILLILVIVCLPFMLIAYAVHRIRRRFSPPPPKILNIRQTPQQRGMPFGGSATRNQFKSRLSTPSVSVKPPPFIPGRSPDTPLHREKLTENKLPDETQQSTKTSDPDTDTTQDSSEE